MIVLLPINIPQCNIVWAHLWCIIHSSIHLILGLSVPDQCYASASAYKLSYIVVPLYLNSYRITTSYPYLRPFISFHFTLFYFTSYTSLDITSLDVTLLDFTPDALPYFISFHSTSLKLIVLDFTSLDFISLHLDITRLFSFDFTSLNFTLHVISLHSTLR